MRFSVLYDIARAHRLIPVREEDWGLQAFRMPGESTQKSMSTLVELSALQVQRIGLDE